MSEQPKDTIPFEMPILRQAIKEVIDAEPNLTRLRDIASMVLDLGKESPVMQQLQIHMLESEDETKKLTKSIELLEESNQDLYDELKKFPLWMRNEKINTMIKIGLGVAVTLGVSQVPDVLALIGF